MDIKELQPQLERLVAEATEALQTAGSDSELNQVKAAWIGKKGRIAELMKLMRDLAPDDRPRFGKLVNEARDQVQNVLDNQRERIKERERQQRLADSAADVTLPGRRPATGGPHPLRLVQQRLVRIFRDMGYRVATGPQIETDYHNFTALNFPPDHPARDEHDTLMVKASHPEFGPYLLRTHTSPVQVRTMLANELPIRVVAPGSVFRSDEVDATHSPCFHQFEGLVVDTHITMSHLKGTLQHFVSTFFGEEIGIRFRPSFFPFTEPSVEVDVQCVFCGGSGCRTCSQTGWIEILGAGMVDPNVLEAAGVDTATYTGFAFGMGIERIAMLLYGVEDIRHFYDNDVRFLRPFAR